MPEKITKLKSGKFRVTTPSGVKSKATTKKKAAAQVRLLRAIDRGWKPTGKPAKEGAAPAILAVNFLLDGRFQLTTATKTQCRARTLIEARTLI